MPCQAAPGDSAVPVRPAPSPAAKFLYTVDAALSPASPVTDVEQLTAAATAAVSVGGGHVLSSHHEVFGNGAVTLVLILAESHLAIHTWPEDNLVAIDLFSCGAIAGDRVLAELVRSLVLHRPSIRQHERGSVAGA